jgi:hypothetical protein
MKHDLQILLLSYLDSYLIGIHIYDIYKYFITRMSK